MDQDPSRLNGSLLTKGPDLFHGIGNTVPGNGVERAKQSLMIIFGNLGFMGIPLVRAMLGDRYIILLVIYLLGFNLLAYSYGIFLAMRMSPKKESFTIGRMFNAGTIASVLSVVIFFFGIGFPAPVSSFLSSMGNMTVPLSMILIGISLGNADLKALAGEKENYIFSAVDMVLIPLAAILFSRQIPVDPAVRVIFCLMVSMPVANLSGMLAEEYGRCGDSCHKLIMFTTGICVLTIPLLSTLF